MGFRAGSPFSESRYAGYLSRKQFVIVVVVNYGGDDGGGGDDDGGG